MFGVQTLNVWVPTETTASVVSYFRILFLSNNFYSTKYNFWSRVSFHLIKSPRFWRITKRHLLMLSGRCHRKNSDQSKKPHVVNPTRLFRLSQANNKSDNWVDPTPEDLPFLQLHGLQDCFHHVINSSS